MTYYTLIGSPLNPLLLIGDGRAITGLRLNPATFEAGIESDWRRDDGPFRDLIAQLASYFAGERRSFDVPLHPPGTTFQRRVWRALGSIPFGETTSYRRVAEQIGSPTATRAVGAANGRNPIAILIPCHRVVGADGSLTGYGGGLGRKQWLLDHEARYANRCARGSVAQRMPGRA